MSGLRGCKANRQKKGKEAEMNRRLGLIGIVVFALDAGVVGGGVTSSLADEAGIEARVGELRGAILSLFAPAGAVATETNPNYKGAATPAPTAPPSPAATDWPSYNKTLTSERASPTSARSTRRTSPSSRSYVPTTPGE